MSQPGKVLISGCSGFVGSQLKSFLERHGHSVCGLTRGNQMSDAIHWDPDKGFIPDGVMDDVDVIINLAGSNIASGRWTENKRKLIRNSRISSTRTLVQAIDKSQSKPSVFISMSGVNYYSADGVLKTEDDPAGESFLSRVCEDWEKEALIAEQYGIRVVTLRLGVVLDKSGGALKKMLPAFKIGMGGPIGSGEQGFPWISLDDLLGTIQFVIQQDSLSGPVNVVHPDIVTQKEFAMALGRAINRPARIPIPSSMVRFIFGQMGEEVLLANILVEPTTLKKAGYKFKESTLEDTLISMFSFE